MSLVPKTPRIGIPPPGRRRIAVPAPFGSWSAPAHLRWVTFHNPPLNPRKLQSTQQLQCRETSPKTLAAAMTAASQERPIF